MRFSHGAEAHQRVIGAPVGLAADVGDGKAQVDEVVPVGRERRVVERLQQRTRDQVRLLVPALARPGVQREAMLLRPVAAGGEILHARLAERHVGKRRAVRRLVVDLRAAEQRGERAVGNQCIMDRGAQRHGGQWTWSDMLPISPCAVRAPITRKAARAVLAQRARCDRPSSPLDEAMPRGRRAPRSGGW